MSGSPYRDAIEVADLYERLRSNMDRATRLMRERPGDEPIGAAYLVMAAKFAHDIAQKLYWITQQAREEM